MINKKQEKLSIRKTERHVRWNWEKSSASDINGIGQARYHFVIVDDKNREAGLNKLLQQLQVYGNVDEVRRVEGKVKNSDLRYLFASFDSPVALRMIKWGKIKKSIVRDMDLRERQRGNIEDYVASVYS